MSGPYAEGGLPPLTDEQRRLIADQEQRIAKWRKIQAEREQAPEDPPVDHS